MNTKNMHDYFWENGEDNSLKQYPAAPAEIKWYGSRRNVILTAFLYPPFSEVAV